MNYIYQLKVPKKLSEADKEPVKVLEFNTDPVLAGDLESLACNNPVTMNIKLAAGRCGRSADDIRQLEAVDYMALVSTVINPLMEGVPVIEKKSSGG